MSRITKFLLLMKGTLKVVIRFFFQSMRHRVIQSRTRKKNCCLGELAEYIFLLKLVFYTPTDYSAVWVIGSTIIHPQHAT